MTGGRLKRVLPYVEKMRHFCLTYGDGVGDIDIAALRRLPSQAARLPATLTAVQRRGVSARSTSAAAA